MSRAYSEQFLISLAQSQEAERIGVKLAKVCVKANLPALYVAEMLGVSRMTVYSWFRGKPLRDKNQQRVNTLVKIVDNDLAEGRLPAMTHQAAKVYIEGIQHLLVPQ